MNELTMPTLDVPGATLTYDVRRNYASDEYGRPGEPEAFAATLRQVLGAYVPGRI